MFPLPFRWRYAYECTRIKTVKRMDWVTLTYIALKRTRYIDLYKRKMAVSLYPPLVDEELEEMREMESKLTVDSIVYFR